MKRLFALLTMVLAVILLAGCGDSLGGGNKSIFTEPGLAAKVMSDLKAVPDLKGKDVKIFQNVVIAESKDLGNFVDINVLKPGTTDKVDNYKYQRNGWTGPNPVQITGSGNMEDNVAPIDAIDYNKLPDIYKVCDEKAKTIEKGEVDKMIVYIYDVNESKYEAVISIKGARETYTATFDAKGNLIKMKKD